MATVIPDTQNLVLHSLFPDRLRPTYWQTEVDPDERPSGFAIVMLSVPPALQIARLVSKEWQREVEDYLRKQVDIIIATVVRMSVQQAIEICNCDQYPDPRALPDETLCRFSAFLGQKEAFSVMVLRNRLESGQHELIVQCAYADTATGGDARLSPERIMVLPAHSFVSAIDFTPEQYQEYAEWDAAETAALERWFDDQQEALLAFGPLRLFTE